MKSPLKMDRVYRHLLERIGSKEFQPGDRLPTEMELARRLEVNRNSVNRAIKRMELEGLVRRNKRAGTYLLEGVTEKVKELHREVSGVVHVLTGRNDRELVYWSEMFLDGLERALTKGDCQARYHEIPLAEDEFQALSNMLSASTSKALAVLPFATETTREIMAKGVALSRYPGEIYLLNRGRGGFGRTSWHEVGFDYHGDGFAAGAKAARLGYRDVVYLGSKSLWAFERGTGIEEGVAASGGDGRVIHHLREDNPTGYAKAIDIIQGKRGKVCVIAQNDITGARFMDEAVMRALCPLNDFGLIVFSNDPAFRRYNMSAFVPDYRQMGEVLGDAIIHNRHSAKNGVKIRLTVGSRFVQRMTTGREKNP